MAGRNALYDALLAPHREGASPFIHRPDGTRISYREAVAAGHRHAHAMAAAGVGPGDRVAVQVAKSPEALFLYFGCLAIGAVYLPLNRAYTAAEVAYFLADAEPALFLCDPDDASSLKGAAAASGARLATFSNKGECELLDRLPPDAGGFDPVAREPEDLAAILYTSGTTGRSKGAMLTHGNLLSNAVALAGAWRFSSADTLLHALPIFHSHGLFVATHVSLLAGAAMIFLPGFDEGEVLRLLPHATTMMGVPTFYTRLLASPGLTREAIAHMRLFVSGSAPLLAETHRLFEQRTGHVVLERYGLTETSMNSSNPYEGERRAGTVGLPLPGVEVRVADAETGAPLPLGQVGSVEVRGPNVFSGYWRMPEKTAEDFRGDGYFITGDLGVIDADGYLSLVGRAKDLIISGGFNVYPKEIELLIDEMSGVVESAVVGVAHSDFGEGVVAVVVAEEGASIVDEDVLAALEGRIAKFKQPKRVYFVPELPRNAMGKVQKKALRESFGDAFVDV